MNLFSKLNFGKAHEDAQAILNADPEELRAADKAERIKFHREKVRNGPVNWKIPTNGQIRRAERRAAEAHTRKAFKGEVRSYFERQRVASFLRPHLQNVGLIAFYDGHEAPKFDQIVSTAWIVQRYGVEVTVDGVGTGHVSFKKGDIIDALKNAARFYQSATGLIIQIPADFEPAAAGGDVIEGVNA